MKRQPVYLQAYPRYATPLPVKGKSLAYRVTEAVVALACIGVLVYACFFWLP